MTKSKRGTPKGDGTRLVRKVEAFRAALQAEVLGGDPADTRQYLLFGQPHDLVLVALNGMLMMQTPDKQHYVDPHGQLRPWDEKVAEVLALGQRLGAARSLTSPAREVRDRVLPLLDELVALDLDYPRSAAISPPTGDVLAPLARHDDRRGAVALPAPAGAPALVLRWTHLGAYLPSKNIVDLWGGSVGGDAAYVGHFEGPGGPVAVRSERLRAVTIDRAGNDSPGVTAPADPCTSLNVTALVRALGEGLSPALLDGARIATVKQPKAVTAEVTWKREPWGWVLEAHLREAKRAIREVHHKFSFDDGGGVDATLHFTLQP